MKLLGIALAVLALQPQVPARDALARAKEAYNDHRFDDAISAATEAGKAPDVAAPAAVVLASAHLERYHAADAEHREPADLDEARAALKDIDASKLTPHDTVEFLVALGESLYLDQPPRYAAAAEMFESALAHSDSATVESRETLIEWWANALDREAQLAPEADRKAIYVRIRDRAQAELKRDDTSAIGLYWVAAASRGAQDLDRAWGAAVAGWVRAGSLGARGVKLRADLDRLIVNVILPERARQLTPSGNAQGTLTLLKEQWDELKRKWER